jgi:hypothetical protein
MSERVFIPADPDRRRELWRQWILTDEPRRAPVIRCVQPRQTSASSDWLPEVIQAPPGLIHGLKTAIADCLVGGTLPVADRERLIARSIKLGLSRFEANLLIAAVQNRYRESTVVSESEARPLSLGWLVLGAVAIETLCVLAAVRFLF